MKIFIQNDNYTLDKGFYMVPDTAITRSGMPLFLPDYAMPCVAYPHIVVRINRLGKCIASQFASRYYDCVTVGFACVAETFKQRLLQEGKPIEPACGFDGAVTFGRWLPWKEEDYLEDIRVMKNEVEAVIFKGKDMLSKIDQQIAELSRYYKLCQGDLLFLGTPKGIDIAIDDILTATWQKEEIVRFKIK